MWQWCLNYIITITVLYIFLFTDAELGVSSVPLCNGQIGSHTAVKLASAVVQDMNLNELEKMRWVFFSSSFSPPPLKCVRRNWSERGNRGEHMWGAGGEWVLGSNSRCHLPLLCHWVTKMQYVGDLTSSDVSPHSCTSYSARTIFMLWLPSIFWLMYLSKNSFINRGLDVWSVRSRMLVAFVTDLSGQIACPKTLVQTTCQCWVTTQKIKDLVYTIAEAWNHAFVLWFNHIAIYMVQECICMVQECICIVQECICMLRSYLFYSSSHHKVSHFYFWLFLQWMSLFSHRRWQCIEIIQHLYWPGSHWLEQINWFSLSSSSSS